MNKLAIGIMLISLSGCSSTPTIAGKSPAAENEFGERVSPGEDALNREIAALSVAVLKKQGVGDKRLTTRDVHAKQHGCVRATFAIEKDVPEEYRAGIFADPGKEYAAWIRFSNGSPKVQDDRKGDARGMAIKLMGVPGDKLLENEKQAQTQDFVLINHDAFFIKDSRDYAEFFKLLEKGSNPAWFFFGRLPWRWTEFTAARRIAKNGKKVTNPLFSRYFSMTPYALGGKNVVKYSARPCSESFDGGNHFAGSPDYLRLNMKRSLEVSSGTAACFQFMVQKRAEPATMSVEDSRIPWDQGKSRFIPIATIAIPAQEFSSEEHMRFCENLSFTPWHGLPAHRPLGNINRTRKVVYETISAYRHEANHAIRREPAVDDNP